MAKKVLFINKAKPTPVIPEMLAGTGYEVYEQLDAETGLRCLESGAYDLVILVENAAAEHWMICSRIRRLTTSPFIVISSGASPESCVKAIDAGADFFLRKPFGPMELMSRINALFLRLPNPQPVPAAS